MRFARPLILLIAVPAWAASGSSFPLLGISAGKDPSSLSVPIQIILLLTLLTLPLAMPVLIFGAQATDLAIRGASFAAPLYLLSAMAVLGVTLAPLAASAAVRISLE